MVTTIRLPDELHRKLKEEAEKKGMTFNGYLLGILWETGGFTKKKEVKEDA